MFESACALQHEKYQQCVALLKRDRLAECIELCHQNISDPNITRYFHIKTLFLLSGAHDENWPEVERYRVEAEKLFEETAELMRKHPKTGTERAADETHLRDFRRELDDMLEWQAYAAPGDDVEGFFGKRAFWGRQGSLMHILFTPQHSAEEEGGTGRDIVADEIKQEVKEAETGAERFPPLHSSQWPCRVCKLSTDGSSIRCSKARHADADVRVTHLYKENKLMFLCSECRSERLASTDGGAQAAGDIPNAVDGTHVGMMCSDCYRTFKQASDMLNNQVKEVQPEPTPSASSDPTMVQILSTLLALQQGQREIQQQQLQMKAALDAHIQKVQQQQVASLRRRALDAHEAAEKLLGK